MQKLRLLDNRHVTLASRITLPSYMVIYGLIGIALMFQPPSRTSSTTFDLPKFIALGNMRPWGAVFLTIAVAMFVSLMLGSRRAEMWCLVAATAVAAFWGLLLLGSAIFIPYISFTAGLWAIGWTPFLIASIASLANHETRSDILTVDDIAALLEEEQ